MEAENKMKEYNKVRVGNRFYDFSNIEIPEYNEEVKKIRIKIDNFNEFVTIYWWLLRYPDLRSYVELDSLKEFKETSYKDKFIEIRIGRESKFAVLRQSSKHAWKAKYIFSRTINEL